MTAVSAGPVGDDRIGSWRREQLARHLEAALGPLDDLLVARIVAEVEWVTVRGGDLVFDQGDHPDALYVLLSGRVRALRAAEDGTTTHLGEIGRGGLLGEMALLDDTVRTARVLAVRDTELARLPRPVFDDLVSRHPTAMLGVVRTVLARVREGIDAVRTRTGSTVVALIAADGSVRLDDIAAALASRLTAVASTVLACPRRFASTIGPTGPRPPEEAETAGALRRWLQALEEQHEVVLLTGGDADSPWARWVAGQADHLVVIADPAGDPTPGLGERRISADTRARRPWVTLVLLQDEATTRPRHTRAWVDVRHVDAALHVRPGSPADLDRLGRHLVGRGVALVLGGGGARGFAHLGVLRALRDLGIPVDTCAGASIGAVFAAMQGLGRTPEELAAMSRHLFADLLDHTPPIVSLMRAERLTRAIHRGLGDRDLVDLWLPTVVVTTSLTRPRAVAHDRGPLARLVRASVSIPAVFPPVVVGDELHVDGGLLDNLPVRAVRSRPGVGTVIAVDVAPRGGPPVRQDHGLDVSGWPLLRDRLVPGRPRPEVPGLVTTVLRSMLAAAERERAAVIAEDLADCLLELDVRGVGLLDFEAVDRVAEVGHAAALPRLEAWLESGVAPGWLRGSRRPA